MWETPTLTPVSWRDNVSKFARGFIVTDTCWPWKRYAFGGYGYFVLFEDYKQKCRVHRFSWELYNNKTVPDGMCVCHSCDNRLCVNPDHLWLGTKGDNNRDRHRKGRTNKKLTAEQVLEIRKSTDSALDLARKYKITRMHVYHIKQRKTWKHL